MSQITDLRLTDYPTMTLVFPDETTVHVCAPTVELVGELRRSHRKLDAILRGDEGDDRAKKATYELAAKLINCNEDDFSTTAQELAILHRVSLRALKVFYDDYVKFINTLENEKN